MFSSLNSPDVTKRLLEFPLSKLLFSMDRGNQYLSCHYDMRQKALGHRHLASNTGYLHRVVRHISGKLKHFPLHLVEVLQWYLPPWAGACTKPFRVLTSSNLHQEKKTLFFHFFGPMSCKHFIIQQTFSDSWHSRVLVPRSLFHKYSLFHNLQGNVPQHNFHTSRFPRKPQFIAMNQQPPICGVSLESRPKYSLLNIFLVLG